MTGRTVACAAILAFLSMSAVARGEDASAPAQPAASSVENTAKQGASAGQIPSEADSTIPTDAAATPPSSGESATDLAKKLANPIADLISIPMELNYDEAYGPNDAGFLKLNIQPVIPFTLSADWNLITRTIIPVLSQEAPSAAAESKFGLGDTIQSFFFSPKELFDGWTWGVGPVFNWPTATDDMLGSEQWGLGPTAVLLKQENGWTYGMLANQIWSVAGNGDRDELNMTFLQPFLAYTFPTATTITLNTESTYNWDSEDWTVPINLKVSQLARLGKLPVQYGLGGRWYVASPDGGPEWGVRFVMTFLLPR